MQSRNIARYIGKTVVWVGSFEILKSVYFRARPNDDMFNAIAAGSTTGVLFACAGVPFGGIYVILCVYSQKHRTFIQEVILL